MDSRLSAILEKQKLLKKSPKKWVVGEMGMVMNTISSLKCREPYKSDALTMYHVFHQKLWSLQEEPTAVIEAEKERLENLYKMVEATIEREKEQERESDGDN